MPSIKRLLCCCCLSAKDEHREPLLGDDKASDLPTSTQPSGLKSSDSFSPPEPIAVLPAVAAKAPPQESSTKVDVGTNASQAPAASEPTGEKIVVEKKTEGSGASGSVAASGGAIVPQAPVPGEKVSHGGEPKTDPKGAADAEVKKPEAPPKVEAPEPASPQPVAPVKAPEPAASRVESETKSDDEAPKEALAGTGKDSPAQAPQAESPIAAKENAADAGGDAPKGEPTETKATLANPEGNKSLKSHPIPVLDRTDTAEEGAMQGQPEAPGTKAEAPGEAAAAVERTRGVPDPVDPVAEDAGNGGPGQSGGGHRGRGKRSHRSGRRGHGGKGDAGRGHGGGGSGRHSRRGRSRGGNHN